MSKPPKRLQFHAKRLSPQQLQRLREEDTALDDNELLSMNAEKSASLYFLGYYSLPGLELALKKYGVYNDLKKRGFSNFKLTMDTRDPYRQRLALYFEKIQPDHLLMEIVANRKKINMKTPFPSPVNGCSFEVLFIEWLCLQNPGEKFAADRLRLPGQEYPGLGMGDTALELLRLIGKRLKLDGVAYVPEFFHNARMYAKVAYFIDPVYEGKRQAMQRDLLKTAGLAMASWAVDLNCVYENDKPFKWFTFEQLWPLNQQLIDYFNHKKYKAIVDKSKNQYHYKIEKNVEISQIE